jgi:hypothetical protein
MDLVGWLSLIAFEAIVAVPAVLLIFTYIGFRRLEKNVRRARMFIMADRIQRFLGALTAGFVVLAAVFATIFMGFGLPPIVLTGAFFFFLATIAYGIVELFFIVRPRRTSGSRSFLRRSSVSPNANPGISRADRTEDDLHASR